MGLLDSFAGLSSGVGVITGAIGIGMELSGANKANNTNAQIAQLSQANSAASLNAEQNRQQQMNLDASRQQRAAYRQAVINRGHEVAASVGSGMSGAVGMQSSGLQGAESQTASQFGLAYGNVSENLQIGTNIFKDQEQIAANQSTMAMLGYDLSKDKAEEQEGQSLFGFSSSLVNHASTGNNNFTSLFGSGGGNSAGGAGD